MAKTRSRVRRTASKPPAVPTTVVQYLAGVPQPARRRLLELRAAIRSAVPRGSTEVISYRIPAFKHGVVLVWYAAFRTHVSLFPGGLALAAFADELASFETSKGTVQFPIDEPLPIALVKRIVKARAAQVAGAMQPVKGVARRSSRRR